MPTVTPFEALRVGYVVAPILFVASASLARIADASWAHWPGP
jgi:hypothetical protein